MLIDGGHSSHAKGKLFGSPARNHLIRRAILTAGFLDLQQQDAAISWIDLMEAAAANALVPFPLPAHDRFLLAVAGPILASGCCWSHPQAAQTTPRLVRLACGSECTRLQPDNADLQLLESSHHCVAWTTPFIVLQRSNCSGSFSAARV